MGPDQASDRRAMPLAEFITEVMEIIRTRPDATEIRVEMVAILRNAEANDNYAAFFTQFNDVMADPHRGGDCATRHHRHARACREQPRLELHRMARKTWIPAQGRG